MSTTTEPALTVRPGGGADLDGPSDHEVLTRVEAAQRLANQADALRLAGMLEFYERRAGDHKARRVQEPNFTMTPLAETAVEVAPLLGSTEGRIRQEVRNARGLKQKFPAIWTLVESGQLDLYRATIVSDAAETHLTDPAHVAELSDCMAQWLRRHLDEVERTRAQHGGASEEPPLVGRTCRQIRNRVDYLIRKLRPKDADERFRRGFERRGVHTNSTGDGLGQLSLSHDVVSLKAVDYRLLLIAKAKRRAGDPRTVEQLRADLAVDLLLGRLTVGGSTGEFEDPDTSPTWDPLDSLQQWPTQRWARPVVNVTVPIQTLMGVCESPGVLSGGESIPPALVRMVAQDPDSTWYRMLTDPARGCVELSTSSYKPSSPIWREVVGAANACFGPVCLMPACECELDHRKRWPKGATSTDNLGPGCKGHHTAKHAPGFGLARGTDGRLAFTTGAGFAHPADPEELPVEDGWGPEGIWEHQFSPSEVRDALLFLAQERRQAERGVALRREIEQEKADYRASYPDATEDEIDGWVHDDDPQAPLPPPILKRGVTLDTVLARESAAERPGPFWDDPDAYDEIA